MGWTMDGNDIVPVTVFLLCVSLEIWQSPFADNMSLPYRNSLVVSSA